MKKLLLIALLAYGFCHWRGGHLGGTPKSVDSTGKPAVIAFTFKECGEPCTSVIAELNNRNVPFREIELAHDNSEDKNLKLFESHHESDMPLVVAGNNRTVGDSKIKLAALLASTFNGQYLTPTESRYFKQHVNADGSPRVVL